MPPVGAAGLVPGVGDDGALGVGVGDGALGVGVGDGVLAVGAALGCAKFDVVAMPTPALGALCVALPLGDVCFGAACGLLGTGGTV